MESGETYGRAGGWEAPGLLGASLSRLPGAGPVSGDQCLRFRAHEPGSDEPRVWVLCLPLGCLGLSSSEMR